MRNFSNSRTIQILFHIDNRNYKHEFSNLFNLGYKISHIVEKVSCKQILELCPSTTKKIHRISIIMFLNLALKRQAYDQKKVTS